MKKCTICEKIFDETVQQTYIKDLDTGIVSPINSLEMSNETGKNKYYLCPQCMRTVLFTGMIFDDRCKKLELVSVDEIAKEKSLSLPIIKW